MYVVVDEFGGKGNVLNFNVGDGVKFALPNVFWTRLQSKYGTVRAVCMIVLAYAHRLQRPLYCVTSELCISLHRKIECGPIFLNNFLASHTPSNL